MRWRESSRFLRNVFLLILAAVFVSLHVAHAVIVYRK
jgi:hypothetical protein